MKNSAKTEEALTKLFGSTSRARILTFLFENIGQPFYQRQIMYETGLSLQAVQREFTNLVDLEIIKKRKTNARLYYEVNISSLFFKPFAEIYRSLSQR